MSDSKPVHKTPQELAAVQCPNCKQIFDISQTGIFPVHFVSLRDYRMRCSTSDTVFAKPSAPAPGPMAESVTKTTKKTTSKRLILEPRHGKVKCPVCDEWVAAKLTKCQIGEHGHDASGKMCNGSYRFYTLPSSGMNTREERVQATIEKYRVRDPETLRKERDKREKAKKRKKQTRSGHQAAAEERRERYRQQKLSDNYAMYAEDSFGREDDGFEPHQRERVWRGGLPGQGRRR